MLVVHAVCCLCVCVQEQSIHRVVIRRIHGGVKQVTHGGAKQVTHDMHLPRRIHKIVAKSKGVQTQTFGLMQFGTLHRDRER